jgi:serine/threonine-protein kinase
VDTLVGHKIGPYELRARLGAGGMGTVYEAVHEILEQERAVKVMSAHLASHASFVSLFRREAMLAAKLRHPNIVQIHDVGEHDGLNYIVMERLSGRTLRDVIKDDAPVAMDRVIHILDQLARALDHAHSQHVSHRDVKPANIFVDGADHVTLVDFGIARAADGTHLTITTGIGTPEYMAPEAFDDDILGPDADPYQLGVGTDLYGLGVVAYELLAGRVPFSGRTPQSIAFAQVHRPAPPIRTHRPDLPEAVEPVLQRQLAKEPGARYPTAVEFVGRLKEAVHSAPLVASPLTTTSTAGPTTPHTPPSLPGANVLPSVPNTPTPNTSYRPVTGPYVPPPSSAGPHTPTPNPVTPTPLGPANTRTPSRSHPGPTTPQGLGPSTTPVPRPPLGAPSRGGSRPTVASGRVDASSQLGSAPAAAQPEGRRVTGTGAPIRAQPSLPKRAAPTGRQVAFGALLLGVSVTVVVILFAAAAISLLMSSDSPAEPSQMDAAATAGAVPELTTGAASPQPAAQSASGTASTLSPPTTAPTRAATSAATVAPSATPVPATPTLTAAQQIAQADAILAAGETGRAVEMATALKGADPSSPGVDDLLLRALLAHGTVLLEAGDIDGSWAAYGKVLELRPDNADARAGQTRVVSVKKYREMEANWGKDDDAALAAAAEVFKADPEYREIREKLYTLQIGKADRQLRAGDREGAFSTLMAALETRPDGAEAKSRLAAYTPTPTVFVPPPTRVPPTPVPYVAPPPTPVQIYQPQPTPVPQPQPTPVPVGGTPIRR